MADSPEHDGCREGPAGEDEVEIALADDTRSLIMPLHPDTEHPVIDLASYLARCVAGLRLLAAEVEPQPQPQPSAP